MSFLNPFILKREHKQQKVEYDLFQGYSLSTVN